MSENQKCAAGAAVTLLAIFFGFSPFLYAIGKWHCYWFATAPICQ